MRAKDLHEAIKKAAALAVAYRANGKPADEWSQVCMFLGSLEGSLRKIDDKLADAVARVGKVDPKPLPPREVN